MLLLIVFAPVLFGGAAMIALLLGTATAGAWEAVEERPKSRPRAERLTPFSVPFRERTSSRAA